MSVLLFKLRDVPDEEADAVRALLEEHQFEIFETSAGRWQISIAAIWLRDEDDYDRARALLDDFQSDYVREVQAEYEAGVQAGDVDTFWHRLWWNPFRVVIYLVVVGLIAYLSVAPFLSF
jgi:hypothetical protein